MATVPLVEQILGVLKEGVSAYKTYLATRQEAYNRQQDKRQKAAIENAEKFIRQAHDIIEYAQDNDKLKDDVRLLKKYRDRFFKYN